MKHTVLLLCLATALSQGSLFAQKRPSSGKQAEAQPAAPAANAGFNTTIYYNDNMSEVKSKGAYYLLINMGSNGLPAGKSRLFQTKGDLLLWEGEYFLFNRLEPGKSKYNGNCIWYYPNKQKMRESAFREGVLDGKSTLYAEDGKPSFASSYRNGKLQGLWSYQDENGGSGKAYLQQFDLMYDSWENNSKDGSSLVDGQALVVHAASKDGYTVGEAMPIETARDFSIETEFRLKTSEMLVMYGQRDTANYFGINISSKGFIRLDQVENGVDKGSAQTFKVTFNRDGNLLKIMKMGNDIFISFNGNMVTSYKYTRFYGNRFGFFLPNRGDVLVYSIKAKELSKGGTTRNEIADVSRQPIEDAPVQGARSRQVDEQPVRSTKKRSDDEGSSATAEMEWKPAGSGFYAAASGWIVTAYSNIAGAGTVGVTANAGGRRVVLNAKIVTTDEANNLAILKIEDSRFVSPGTVPYALSSLGAEVGESVFTVNYPLENILTDEMMLDDGTVSSRSANGNTGLYQVSASGNGGPLLDKNGNLLGMSLSPKKAVKTTLIINLIQALDEAPRLNMTNSLKGRPLKDQVRQLKGFVPIICVK